MHETDWWHPFDVSDKQGRLQPNADELISFTLTGPGLASTLKRARNIQRTMNLTPRRVLLLILTLFLIDKLTTAHAAADVAASAPVTGGAVNGR